jgi:hypothetical protein
MNFFCIFFNDERADSRGPEDTYFAHTIFKQKLKQTTAAYFIWPFLTAPHPG